MLGQPSDTYFVIISTFCFYSITYVTLVIPIERAIIASSSHVFARDMRQKSFDDVFLSDVYDNAHCSFFDLLIPGSLFFLLTQTIVSWKARTSSQRQDTENKIMVEDNKNLWFYLPFVSLFILIFISSYFILAALFFLILRVALLDYYFGISFKLFHHFLKSIFANKIFDR